MGIKTKVYKKNPISLAIAISLLLIFLATISVFFYLYFIGKIYPGIFIAGINVSGKSEFNAASTLESEITPPENITLNYSDKTFIIRHNSLNINYNFDKSVKRAILLGRSGNLIFDIEEIAKTIINKKSYGLEFSIDENSLDKEIASIAAQITTKPINPTFQISSNKLIITPGKTGTKIDDQKLKSNIKENISQINLNPIQISITESIFDSTAFIDNTVDEIAKQFDADPVNAKFVFESGQVKNFLPEKNGIKVDKNKLKSKIESGETTIDIPLLTISSKIKTSDINNLGIKELVGSGTSHFAGSIPSRIYNVNLAASRINNALIAPNDTFSFDNTVGDISALNGYQQAYVIENGKTVLGDGGGVCQVSTTMFRAAMNAGLPIIERHAHAYRVHYYEEDAPAGMDATIYSPTVDFKFKNDTGNYILIQTNIDLRNLVLTFNLYGTKDGREISITKPTLWDYKPAPADSYTDDPTLPAGLVKQIDFAATGIKSQFVYTVTKESKEINKQTFYSDFEPWQAKFLRGTKT
jgi:vancomycin resistance protein YoaR